jgi:hypothetical protein
MEKIKLILKDWKGVNYTTSDFEQGLNEASDLQNIYLGEKRLQKRYGYNHSENYAGHRIRELYDFILENGSSYLIRAQYTKLSWCYGYEFRDSMPDEEHWSFQTIQDKLYGLCSDQKATVVWYGAVGPTTALTAAAGAAGGPTGTFIYRVLYHYIYDWSPYKLHAQKHPSDLSPASNSITVTNKKIMLSNIPIGPEGVIGRSLYKSTGGGPFKWIYYIEDNVTTDWIDLLSSGSTDPPTPETKDMGVDTPATPCGGGDAGVAGNPNGTYKYKYTYLYYGFEESNGSNPSSPVTVVSKKINVSAISLGGVGVTDRKLYRTVDGGDIYYYVGTLTGNDSTVFPGFDNVADADLGPAIDEAAGCMGAPAPLLRGGSVANTGSGVLTGDYNCVTTFVYSNSKESRPSPVSNTDTLANEQFEVEEIPIGGAGVVARKLYRCKAADSRFYLMHTLNDNTTTEYTDNTADGSLGAEVVTMQSLPPKGEQLLWSKERAFILGRNIARDSIYYSKLSEPDIFSENNYLEVDSQAGKNTAIFDFLGRYIIFKLEKAYLWEGPGYVARKVSDAFGCIDWKSIQMVEIKGVKVLAFLSKQGICIFDGLNFTIISGGINKELLNYEGVKNPGVTGNRVSSYYADKEYHLLIRKTTVHADDFIEVVWDGEGGNFLINSFGSNGRRILIKSSFDYIYSVSYYFGGNLSLLTYYPRGLITKYLYDYDGNKVKAALTAYWISKEITLKDVSTRRTQKGDFADRVKFLRKIKVLARGDNMTLTVSISADRAAFVNHSLVFPDAADKLIVKSCSPALLGTSFRIKLYNATVDKDFGIEQVELHFQVKEERANV